MKSRNREEEGGIGERGRVTREEGNGNGK